MSIVTIQIKGNGLSVPSSRHRTGRRHDSSSTAGLPLTKRVVTEQARGTSVVTDQETQRTSVVTDQETQRTSVVTDQEAQRTSVVTEQAQRTSVVTEQARGGSIVTVGTLAYNNTTNLARKHTNRAIRHGTLA